MVKQSINPEAGLRRCISGLEDLSGGGRSDPGRSREGTLFAGMPSRDEVASFIRATFRSVWALELLCFLRQNRDRSLSHAEMVAGLRGSDLVVTQSVESLAAAGLVLAEADGSARYAPASADLDRLVGQAEALYAQESRCRSADDRRGRQSRHHRFRRRVQAEEGLRPMAYCFPALVYLLCFLTSSACALLLARSYRAHRRAAAAVERALLPVARRQQFRRHPRPAGAAGRSISGLARLLLALAAVGVLLFGFIWDLEE